MNQSRLTSDYSSLEGNEFWKLIVLKLRKSGATRLEQLRSAPLENVPRIRGEIIGIEYALGLPEAILTELKNMEVK